MSANVHNRLKFAEISRKDWPIVYESVKKLGIENSWNIMYLTPADLLWMAPELLRERQQRPSSGGSQKRSQFYLKMVNLQKCDVYSFAIILQEFHTRKGPYSNNSNLSTRGT